MSHVGNRGGLFFIQRRSKATNHLFRMLQLDCHFAPVSAVRCTPLEGMRRDRSYLMALSDQDPIRKLRRVCICEVTLLDDFGRSTGLLIRETWHAEGNLYR